MKLLVRIISAPGTPGGKALALCTEDGEVLPMQRSCVVENEAQDAGVITVSFYIDGKSVRFADNDG